MRFSINHMIDGVPYRVSAYKLEAMTLALRAGRAIISRRAGNRQVQPGTTRRGTSASYGMAWSVLVVCPTSLRHHWKMMLGDNAVVIEGEARAPQVSTAAARATT